MSSADQPSFLERHDFLIRRLHSLSGLLPVGAYLVVHLLTNATVLNGAYSFQSNVDTIHSLGKVLPLVEWTFIFLPLIFHAVVGVAIIRSGRYNVGSYAYSGNVRYYLQRVTAWIALFFIFGHVFHLHGWVKSDWVREMGGAQFNHYFATTSAGRALQSSFLIQVFYAIGLLSTIFHFANGIWTMGITWGVWTTAAAMRRANYLCAALGLFLAVVGFSALGAMTTVDTEQSLEIEQKMNAHKISAGELTAEELEAHPLDEAETKHSESPVVSGDDEPMPPENRRS